jgi:FKBP-type peptidyl-prolyl cis-trans isomerase
VHSSIRLFAPMAAGLFLVACNSGQPGADAQVSLESVEAKASYALAYSYLNQLDQGRVDVDLDAFVAGASDYLSGRPSALSDTEIQAAFQVLQQQIQEEAMAELEQMSQGALVESEAFLAENAGREGVQVTESGLQYQVIQSGEGASPEAGDTVRVHYTGRLLDGTVFDSSVARNEPAEFGVTQVIPGWVEALQLMKVGDKWEIYLHPDLGYGISGAGGLIGPNSLLIFEVELLAILED